MSDLLPGDWALVLRAVSRDTTRLGPRLSAGNVAEALERAARPVRVVPASTRCLTWQEGAGWLRGVDDPATVQVRPGTAPAWERARRLLEEP